MPRPPTTSTTVLEARERMLGAVDAEILAEQASSLGRAGRRLERAIADLAAFDAGKAPKRRGRNRAPDRPGLVAEAKDALWHLVVQREACGMHSSADVLTIYQVPAEVSRNVTLPQLGRRRA